jgi:hypothetical protein
MTMRGADIEIPAQKPVSELAFGSDINWTFLPMNEGALDTAATTMSFDSRGNTLSDVTVGGTLGTAWSDKTGFLSGNNSINVHAAFSTDAGLEPVFDFIGNTVLVGFQCIMPKSATREVIAHVGGGASSNEFGLNILREISTGRIATFFRDSGGTSNNSGPRCGDMYDISGVTAGATPTVTVTHPTKTKHSLIVGEHVYISANDDTTLQDGLYTVVTTPADLTFTIDATENGGGAATGDATEGHVGPKCNVAIVVDDVSKTAQIWINQVGETAWDEGSVHDYSALTALSATDNTPGFNLLEGHNNTNLLTGGLVRRFLWVNYGAQTQAQALPTLSTRVLPALRRSQMLPTWGLLG